MRPAPAVRFAHSHGSASRRRSSFATPMARNKVTAPQVTPAEKQAHDALKTAEVIKAA